MIRKMDPVYPATGVAGATQARLLFRHRFVPAGVFVRCHLYSFVRHSTPLGDLRPTPTYTYDSHFTNLGATSSSLTLIFIDIVAGLWALGDGG